MTFFTGIGVGVVYFMGFLLCYAVFYSILDLDEHIATFAVLLAIAVVLALFTVAPESFGYQKIVSENAVEVDI